MEYVYAALLLHEADEEINEDNLSAVLDAAGLDVEESRVKALVAALEDVDIEEALQQAAAAPAAGGAPSDGAAEAAGEEEADETMPEAADEEEAEEAEAEEDEGEEEEEVSGEGLGDLFG